jgi:hypothetical protein
LTFAESFHVMSALPAVIATSEEKVGLAVELIKFPLASVCCCSSSVSVPSIDVIVKVAGLEERCKKVPEDALVATNEQAPVAIGVMRPALLIEHFAGVVVLKE